MDAIVLGAPGSNVTVMGPAEVVNVNVRAAVVLTGGTEAGDAAAPASDEADGADGVLGGDAGAEQAASAAAAPAISGTRT